MRAWIVENVAKNLCFPQKGVFGRLIRVLLKQRNRYLEENAVRLCNIKPDYNVLEIGFGHGVGLEAAYNIVRNGKGKVFGVDYSFYMVESAVSRLKNLGVPDGKVMLYHANVSQMPLNTDSVQRVFHCNCYYFWPNFRSAIREIYRVMQPGGIMVTTLSFDVIKSFQELGFLKYARTDPVAYMNCLENCGFENVHMEYHTDTLTGKKYQAIFAKIGEKPAHEIFKDNDDEEDEFTKKSTAHKS